MNNRAVKFSISPPKISPKPSCSFIEYIITMRIIDNKTIMGAPYEGENIKFENGIELFPTRVELLYIWAALKMMSNAGQFAYGSNLRTHLSYY